MPYASIDQVPDYVKKKTKSKKKLRQWVAVYNSVYRQTGSESRAFAAANSKLKDFNIMTYKQICDLIGLYVKGRKKGKYNKEDNEE